MGLILETSILIAAERRTFDLTSLLASQPGEVLALASITLSELRHGCLRAADPAIRRRREQFVSDVVSRVVILPFGSSEAEHHASLWVELASKGQMIGPHDLLIAATARSLGYSLATLNQSEFARVQGLKLVPVQAFQRH